ncbi:hypothetical protein ACFVUN_14865 [Kitasatospora griseola]|uniref:hypothetical protein n=1 Tax=Kitasatospora griseola TaxID=2064 RepID=UPI0036D8C007
MNTAFRGTLLATAPLFAAVPLMVDASARFQPPTTDATCVLHGHGAEVRGSGTLAMTGTATCVDAAGSPVAAGTFARSVAVSATECDGDEDASTTVRWSDGTASTVRYGKGKVVTANGTASLIADGAVTADSTRFAGDTVHAVGTSTGTGCGIAAGKATVDSTLVLRLIH